MVKKEPKKILDVEKIILIVLFIILTIITLLNVFSPIGISSHCLPHDNIRFIMVIIIRIIFILGLVSCFLIIRSNKVLKFKNYVRMILILLFVFVLVPFIFNKINSAIEKYDFNKYADEYCTVYKQMND